MCNPENYFEKHTVSPNETQIKTQTPFRVRQTVLCPAWLLHSYVGVSQEEVSTNLFFTATKDILRYSSSKRKRVLTSLLINTIF